MVLPALAAHFLLICQANTQTPLPSPLALSQPIRDKNFYFFTLIRRDARAVRLLMSDPILSEISRKDIATLRSIYNSVGLGKIGPFGDLRYSQESIELVGNRLRELVTQGRLTDLLRAVRLSGAYQNDAGRSDAELIVKCWEICAGGINRIIDVYGAQAVGARSAGIDSPIYTSKNPLFGGLLKTLVGVEAEQLKPDSLFFEAGLDVARRLLEIQLREEAGRYEPMEHGVNRSAFGRARHTDFTRYTYSAILVPGYGPEESEVRLSPVGRMQCELAARDYRRGLAPFIIVSGGHVHPNRTPYSEAIEMKRDLIEEFGIPEAAIIVDPHARHTTTNIRNAARLIYRYGLPFNKRALIVTNSYQRADIESSAFQRRCLSVFGFEPGTSYQKISEFETSFLPNLASLTIDPTDPLDP